MRQQFQFGNADKTKTDEPTDGTLDKSLVVMSGPLSEVYTQALNVAFAKVKPEVEGEDTTPTADDTAIEVSPAVESMANDLMMQQTLDKHDDNPDTSHLFVDLGNEYKIQTDTEVEVREDAIVEDTTGVMDDVPSIVAFAPAVNEISTLSTLASTNVAVGQGSDVVVIMDPTDAAATVSISNDEETLSGTAAMEAIYSKLGATMVVGLNGFVNYLKTKQKSAK